MWLAPPDSGYSVFFGELAGFGAGLVDGFGLGETLGDGEGLGEIFGCSPEGGGTRNGAVPDVVGAVAGAIGKTGAVPVVVGATREVVPERGKVGGSHGGTGVGVGLGVGVGVGAGLERLTQVCNVPP